LQSRVGQRCSPASVIEHDCVVLGGDFNFRLALPANADVDIPTRKTMQKSWPSFSSSNPGCIGEGVPNCSLSAPSSTFALYDELQGSKAATDVGEILRRASLTEGPVLFPATYRMTEGTCAYDTERIPAWCDRVLHSKIDTVRRRYCAIGGIRQSDHMPVCCFLELSLLALPGWKCPDPPSNLRSSSYAADCRTFDRALQESPVLQAAKAAAPSPPADLLDLGGTSGGYESINESAVNAGNPPAKYTSSSTNLLDCPIPSGVPQYSMSPKNESLTANATTVDVKMGQLVRAHYQGGWYLAHVTRVGGGTCDVAWLRPAAGSVQQQQHMHDYLCSTDADETCHGDNLPLATHVRVAAAMAKLGVVASQAAADLLDLSAPPAATQDLLG